MMIFYRRATVDEIALSVAEFRQAADRHGHGDIIGHDGKVIGEWAFDTELSSPPAALVCERCGRVKCLICGHHEPGEDL